MCSAAETLLGLLSPKNKGQVPQRLFGKRVKNTQRPCESPWPGRELMREKLSASSALQLSSSASSVYCLALASTADGARTEHTSARRLGSRTPQRLSQGAPSSGCRSVLSTERHAQGAGSSQSRGDFIAHIGSRETH